MTEQSGEHAPPPGPCEARDCPKSYITSFTDGAGESWWLCEQHGDMLAVGFPTRRARSTPLPYEAVRRVVEP